MIRPEIAKRVESALVAHGRDLLRYLESRIGSDQAADALSETMLIAWRRARRMPASDHDARLWLFGIARNVVRNSDRSARRRSRLAAQIGADARVRGAQLAGADEGFEVREAISRLDPKHAEVVRAVHWDGFSLAEFAAIEGIPASTARSRYRKAKAQLASELSARDTCDAD